MVINVRVNLTLHAGNRVQIQHMNILVSRSLESFTFALKSLTSKERKSMSLISDRMKSLEENGKNSGAINW